MMNSSIGIIRSRRKNIEEIISGTYNYSSSSKPGSLENISCDFNLPKTDIEDFNGAVKLGSGVTYIQGLAQTITPTENCYITDVFFGIYATGSPTGPIYVRLYTVSGTLGVNAIPSVLLGELNNDVFGYLDASNMPFFYTEQFPHAVNFSNPGFPITLQAGNTYMISIEYYSGTSNDYISVCINDNVISYDGNAVNGSGSSGVISSWNAMPNAKICLVSCGYTDTFSILKYDFSNTDSYKTIGVGGVKSYGVVVTGNGGVIKTFEVLIDLLTGASNVDNITLNIYSLSGGFPTGSSLMSFNSISLSSSYSFYNNYFVFTPASTAITLTSGTNYGFVITTTAANPATDVKFGISTDSSSSTYTNNTFYQNHGSSTWVNEVSTRDMTFLITTSVPLVEAVFETYDATLNGDQFNYIAATQNTKMAQSFTGIAGAFSKVSVNLRATGSPTGNITASLFADDGGTFGTTGKPTGTALATSTAISASTISATETQYTFTFGTPYNMTAGTIYWIAIEYSSGSSSNKIGVVVDISSPTAPGRCAYYNGTTWAFTTYDSVGTSGATDDLCYVLYALT